MPIRLLAVGVLLALAPRVSAHAVLRGTTPASGAALDQAPRELVLRFSEPVTPLSVKLLDAGGLRVAGSGAPTAVDDEVRLSLSEPLPRGSYLASYRVVSGDSHPIGGSFTFSVGPAATAAKPALVAPAGADPWLLPVRGVRLFFTLGLLLGAGSGWLLLLLRPPPEIARQARALARIGAAVAVVGGCLHVALAGAQLLGDGFPWSAFDPRAFSAGARSTVGRSTALGVAGLLSVVAGARQSWPSRRLLSLGVLLSAASRALTGHPASLSPRWLLSSAIFVHVAALSFWFASLVLLSRSLGRFPLQVTRPLTERFSRLALAAVALLALAGTAMSLVQLRSLGQLLSTDYGRLLSLKLVFFAAILVLAAYNKRRLVPRLRAGIAPATRALCASMTWEIAVLVAIAWISAALASTAPPRDEGALGAFRAAAAAGEHRLAVTLRPAEASAANQIELSFSDARGNVFDPPRVEVEIDCPSRGLEPLKLEPQKQSAGVFVIPGVRPLLAGQWRLRVDAFVTDFDKEGFLVEVTFR